MTIDKSVMHVGITEECPVWLGKGKRVHHSFPDPTKTDDINDFRKVRDEIEREIIYLLVNYGNNKNTQPPKQVGK